MSSHCSRTLCLRDVTYGTLSFYIRSKTTLSQHFFDFYICICKIRETMWQKTCSFFFQITNFELLIILRNEGFINRNIWCESYYRVNKNAVWLIYSSSFCLSIISLVTRAMTSGCSRQSSISLVDIRPHVAPPFPSSSSSSDTLIISSFPWVSVCSGFVVFCVWKSVSSFATKASLGFVTGGFWDVSAWQVTGMRWGPKGNENEVKGPDTGVFKWPLESLFKAKGLSCAAHLPRSSECKLLLFMYAFSARFKYCMFSSCVETPSFNTTPDIALREWLQQIIQLLFLPQV